MNNKNPRSAFTLTETIVAMSIFAIGIVIAIGSFVRALKTQRVLTHLMSVNSNTSLVLEEVAREIRTGYNFSALNTSGACPANSFGDVGDELKFTNARGNDITYKKSGTEIIREECSGADCSSANFSPVTASDVAVKSICFLNIQNDPSRDPWRISIFLRTGSSRFDLKANFIDIQTTISSRVLPSDLAP